jgi:hypothetical protein
MAQREETVDRLKERVAKLEAEIERAESVRDCRNVGNKYQMYHWEKTYSEAHLFALKTPDVRVEMLWGIYDGPGSVIKWKTGEGYGMAPIPIGAIPANPHPGNHHAMGTPIIEVAKDGKTARGLWLMFAYYNVCWAAGQFAMDFIKEDGEWKVWHYNTTGLIYTPFEKGWHVANREVLERMQEMNEQRPIEERPDRPASYAWMWGPDEYFQNIPPVPEPYESWDESLACIPEPGREWEIKKFK